MVSVYIHHEKRPNKKQQYAKCLFFLYAFLRYILYIFLYCYYIYSFSKKPAKNLFHFVKLFMPSVKLLTKRFTGNDNFWTYTFDLFHFEVFICCYCLLVHQFSLVLNWCNMFSCTRTLYKILLSICMVFIMATFVFNVLVYALKSFFV